MEKCSLITIVYVLWNSWYINILEQPMLYCKQKKANYIHIDIIRHTHIHIQYDKICFRSKISFIYIKHLFVILNYTEYLLIYIFGSILRIYMTYAIYYRDKTYNLQIYLTLKIWVREFKLLILYRMHTTRQ